MVPILHDPRLPGRSGPRGFSLIELMMVVALLAILVGIAVPSFRVNDRMRLDAAAREVQHELQGARLKAVNVNRRLEVRFNCPAAGQYRVVEGGWPDAGRCDPAKYPYPSPADAGYSVPPMPRYDGPPRQVNQRVTLAATAATLEFSPDGRTATVSGNVATFLGSGSVFTVTLTLNGLTRTVNINGLGKVQFR